MVIYIDNQYHCHVSNDGTMRQVEKNLFDGHCTEYVEGYVYVPPGETWTREDGEVFDGEMIAPWKPWLDLDDAQREYERELINQLSAENETLIADMAQTIEEVYQSDMEMMGI